MKTHISCRFGCLGDRLAFVSAARLFARAHPDQDVTVAVLPEVLGAYADGLVRPGTPEDADRVLRCEPFLRHRVRDASPDLNYVGTFAAELGLPLVTPPAIEVPDLEPPAGLEPRRFVALQPRSGSAANPPDLDATLAAMVAACREVCPEWPVVLVGRPDTQRVMGADDRFLGGPLDLLRAVQHAAFVVTPRSATAHAAAGYRVPTFVWVPADGESWHLDYPWWPHVRVGAERARDAVPILLRFARDVRRGHFRHPGSLARRLAARLEWAPALFLGVNARCPSGLVSVGPGSEDDQLESVIAVVTNTDFGLRVS